MKETFNKLTPGPVRCFDCFEGTCDLHPSSCNHQWIKVGDHPVDIDREQGTYITAVTFICPNCEEIKEIKIV